MSVTQPKDTALKTKESAAEVAAPLAPLSVKTAGATGRKTLTSSAALSLFDQLKNSVNTNSLTIGAGVGNNSSPEATPPITAPASTTTASPILTPKSPPPTPPINKSPSLSSNIELKPPAKPARPFTSPSTIGIVQGTKRGWAEFLAGLEPKPPNWI